MADVDTQVQDCFNKSCTRLQNSERRTKTWKRCLLLILTILSTFNTSHRQHQVFCDVLSVQSIDGKFKVYVRRIVSVVHVVLGIGEKSEHTVSVNTYFHTTRLLAMNRPNPNQYHQHQSFHVIQNNTMTLSMIKRSKQVPTQFTRLL